MLAHEANIDALWDGTISKMLQARFPGATSEDLLAARAYAYGGCVIQDLGYYPFGSHFFSNLVDKLATRGFADVPPALRENIVACYGAADPLPGEIPDEQKRSTRIRLQLASLTAARGER